jgi:16S rRNA (cytosine1402-N4)-methyltransferase
MNDIYHIPVLLSETMEQLAVKEGGVYVDATFGGGGHSREIVKRGGRVIGIDQDKDAHVHFKKNPCDGITLALGNFRNLAEIVRDAGEIAVDGVLADLGVSSHQLNTPERGFSYRFEHELLDLRMDTDAGVPASDWILHQPEEVLYEIFATLGEEERARSIAHAVISARRIKETFTTGDLVECIHTGAGYSGMRLKDSASRIFQAIRMALNDEKPALRSLIEESGSVIRPGGRICIISYHSLEDRIVKLTLDSSGWRVLTKRPIIPTDLEVARNPRSRSAKMRTAEKM